MTAQLLIAPLEMADPQVRNAVILVVRHDAGVRWHRHHPVARRSVSGLLEAIGYDAEGVSGNAAIYFGVLVHPENGFILHDAGGICFAASCRSEPERLMGNNHIRPISLIKFPRSKDVAIHCSR